MRGPTTLVALDVVGRSVVLLLMVVRTAEDSEEESKSQYLRWKHFVVARALGRDFRLLHIHLPLLIPPWACCHNRRACHRLGIEQDLGN